VDVERGARLHDLVGETEHAREVLHGQEAAVGDGVQMGEVEHGADPAEAPRDGEDVFRRPQLAHPSHDLDAERDRPVLALQALA